MKGASHGKGDNCQNGQNREVSGCVKEASVNEQDTRANVFFIQTSWETRFQLLVRCTLKPRDVVPVVKSQEVGQVLAYLEDPLWIGLVQNMRSEPAKYA